VVERDGEDWKATCNVPGCVWYTRLPFAHYPDAKEAAKALMRQYQTHQDATAAGANTIRGWGGALEIGGDEQVRDFLYHWTNAVYSRGGRDCGVALCDA
jgi:hypothetical protein